MNVRRDLCRLLKHAAPLLLLTMPALAHAAEDPAPAPELIEGIPKGWEAGKASPLRKASFLVRDGDRQADVSVVVLRTISNALVPNVNRWRAQLKLEAAGEAAIRKSLEEIKVAGEKGHYVDIRGEEARILAVIVPRGKQIWFFKMMGDEQLVGAQKAAFEAFVKATRFDDDPPK